MPEFRVFRLFRGQPLRYVRLLLFKPARAKRFFKIFVIFAKMKRLERGASCLEPPRGEVRCGVNDANALAWRLKLHENHFTDQK